MNAYYLGVTPSEMRERNPFIPITGLVLALAVAAGFGMRYGMNGIVAAICVVAAMVGTWILLSPQSSVALASTATPRPEIIRGTAPAPVDQGAISSSQSAFAGCREQLRSRPRSAVGFSGVSDRDAVIDEYDPLSESAMPVRTLGQLPSDASSLQIDHHVEPDPTASGAFTLARFEVRAASQQGSDHAVLSEPRQDDYAVAQAAGGRYLVVVLADGHGIAENAHFGAHWSCRFLAQAIDRNLREGVPGIEKMLSRTRDDVTDLFHAQFTDGSKLRTIATTLAGFIAPVDGGPAAGFRVGTTDILVDGDQGWTSVFGAAQPDPDLVFPRSIDAEVAPIDLDVNALLLASDDVATSLQESPIVGAAFSNALSSPIGQDEFAALVDFDLEDARGDRTAAAVWFVQR